MAQKLIVNSALKNLSLGDHLTIGDPDEIVKKRYLLTDKVKFYGFKTTPFYNLY